MSQVHWQPDFLFRSGLTIIGSQLAVGYTHNVALKRDGSLWAWGLNNLGQLGDGTMTDRLTPVQIGLTLIGSLLLREVIIGGLETDGSLWAWGLTTSVNWVMALQQ